MFEHHAVGVATEVMLRSTTYFVLCACLAVSACETSGPTPTDAGSDASSVDAQSVDVPSADVLPPTDARSVDAGACAPLATDYIPRSRMPSMPQWPACASDDGAFVPNDMSISTIGRVRAFDQIDRDPAGMRAQGFFDPARDPSADEFTAARVVYAQDNGLGSRVERRSDEHYPQPMENDCQMATVVTANPDYCVGPSRLLPVINAAFAAGQTAMAGSTTRVFAARIEAALLWFLYLSPYKESLTCTASPRDCDSAWAYYTAGQYDPRATEQYGLARRAAALEPATHARVWDGLLAVRCWQQADPMNAELRDRARTQLDRALTRAIALVLTERVNRVASTAGAERDAHFAFVKVMGPLFDRAARAANPAIADQLAAAFRGDDPATFPGAMVSAALQTLFPCP